MGGVGEEWVVWMKNGRGVGVVVSVGGKCVESGVVWVCHQKATDKIHKVEEYSEDNS